MCCSVLGDSNLFGPWAFPVCVFAKGCNSLSVIFFPLLTVSGLDWSLCLWFLWLFTKEASKYDLNKDFPKIVFLLWTAWSSESTLGSGETHSSWVVLLVSVPSYCCCMLSIDGTPPGTLDNYHFQALIWNKEKWEGEVDCVIISLTSRIIRADSAGLCDLVRLSWSHRFSNTLPSVFSFKKRKSFPLLLSPQGVRKWVRKRVCASVIVSEADGKPGLTAGLFGKPGLSLPKDCFPFSCLIGLWIKIVLVLLFYTHDEKSQVVFKSVL